MTLWTCGELSLEPMVFSIRSGPAGVEVRRTQGEPVERLTEGTACGAGEGVCQDDLECLGHRCTRAERPDAGPVGVDGGIDPPA